MDYSLSLKKICFKKGALIIIKARINFPFIYVLLEPTIVLMVKIEMHNYITQTDFINKLDRAELFEISTEEEFNQFQHEKYNSMEGRGIPLQQEDINKLVEEINNKMQNYLRCNNHALQQGPIHLVMSESAAGTLRVGLPRPKTVIAIRDSFEIGPLWQLDKNNGLALRNEWLNEHINVELEDAEYLNHFNNTLRQIEDIPKNIPLFILYSDNGDEQVGLRFILYLLKDRNNDIFLINTTKLYKKENPSVYHTSQMHPDDLRMLFENDPMNGPLPKEQLLRYHSEWEELAETHGVLRLWVDESIKHVSEDYYDSFIIETIERLHKQQQKKDWIKAANLLIELMQSMKGAINIFYLEYRIRELIYNGLLELKGIPKSMRHYSIKLR